MAYRLSDASTAEIEAVEEGHYEQVVFNIEHNFDFHAVTPREVGINHDTWRNNQESALQTVADIICSANTTAPTFLELPTGCHAAGQKILTYGYDHKLVEDIEVGDVLMGWDYSPRHVLQLCRGTGKMYRIRLEGHDPMIVNEDHILTLIHKNHLVTKDVSVKDYLSWNFQEQNCWVHFQMFENRIERISWSVESLLETQPYYGFILDGDGRYLLDNFIVTHNSGKSGIATALAVLMPVIVYVQSHSLLDQYHDQYGFEIVKGMASYNCILPEKVESYRSRDGRDPLVSECHFDDMSLCPVADRCPYLVARERALASDRMACTYAFGALSYKVRIRHGIQVMDEAHMVASIATGLSEIVLNRQFIRDFGLPEFPYSKITSVIDTTIRGKLKTWVSRSLKILKKPPQNIFFEEQTEWLAAAQRLGKFWDVISSSDPWFFEIDPQGHTYKARGSGKVLTERKEPQMVLKPLQAKSVLPNLVGAREHQIYMTATLGDPAPLAQELGFDTAFSFFSYPHPVPIDKRPVFDMGYERMTWENISKKRNSIFQIQAIKMAAWISQWPKDWRGIILVPSYDKRRETMEALGRTVVSDRLMQFDPEHSVGERVNAFIKNSKPGAIAVDISQGWGHGIDLSWNKARFATVAGVPFGNFKDSFTSIRMSNIPGAKNMEFWRSFTEVTQICGRVSRGEQMENGDYLFNPSLLADGSAVTSMAKAYYSEWFSKSIVPVR